MPTSDTSVLVRSRRVLLPSGEAAADLVLRSGSIVEIGAHGALDADVVDDVGEAALMPGLIDAHCHVNQPGRTHWEGFETASRAAISGGITLLADMPLNSDPVTTSPSALELKIDSARIDSRVDVAFYGGVVPGNAGDEQTLSELSRAGCAAFKVFLCPSGLHDFPATSQDELRPAVNHLAALGKRLLVHAELFQPNETADPAPMETYERYLASRPEAAELRAIEAMAELCELTGCAVHIVHLSAARALPLLEDWRQQGLPITVETCPHYLTFTAEEIEAADQRPLLFKCAPPIRSAANRELLWAGLNGGVIDFVATDHSPCPPEDKQLDSDPPAWGEAWGGISSLQLLLPATWTEARERGHSLADLARWLSSAPAAFLGCSDRGALLPGSRADLVVWHPERSFRVDGASLAHRHPLTPYQGRELHGVVERTYLAGVPVFDATLGGVLDGPKVSRPLRLRAGIEASYSGFADHFGAEVEPSAVHAHLEACCGARRWQEEMTRPAPFERPTDLFRASERSFDALRGADWLEAFAAHPRIGDLQSLAARFAHTEGLAAGEQSGTRGASEETLRALAAANLDYEQEFGYVFLICASGKTAEQMLEALQARLDHDPDVEFEIACEEQRKITFLRLEKLCRE